MHYQIVIVRKYTNFMFISKQNFIKKQGAFQFPWVISNQTNPQLLMKHSFLLILYSQTKISKQISPVSKTTFHSAISNSQNQVIRSLSYVQSFFTFAFIITIRINMDCEDTPIQMQIQGPIMMMIDGLFEAEDSSTLLEDLSSVPQTTKKGSITYDYQPAKVQLIPESNEEYGIKNSNTSTSTCPEEVVVRKCTCTKTRCQKNYCECFKLGEACSSICECKDCGNKEKLFLSKPVAIKIKCKCLKSHCLKNYCECHSSGQRCGPDCKCVECENLDLIKQQEGESFVNYFEHHLFFDI